MFTSSPARAYKPRVRRLLVIAILAGCATAKPRGCAQIEVRTAAPEGTTERQALRAPRLADESIALTTLDGQPAKFSDFIAPVTVIAFWATWCHPCLEELPYVELLQQLYKSDPEISIVGVSIDQLSALGRVETLVAELGLTFPVLHDPGRKLLNQFTQNIGIPLLVFIDRDFKQYRELGFSNVSADDFLATKRELIERARGGALPNEPPGHSAFSAVRPGDSATMRFGPGALSGEARPQVRANLKRMFPASTDKELDQMMVKVEEAARTGEQVRFENPQRGTSE